MDTIKEIRLTNLEKLIDKHKSMSEFCAKIGKSPSAVSQIKSGRGFGDKLARNIERSLGIESGWMDHHHLSDADTVTSALKIIEQKLNDMTLDPGEYELLRIYRRLSSDHQMDMHILARKLERQEQ